MATIHFPEGGRLMGVQLYLTLFREMLASVRFKGHA